MARTSAGRSSVQSVIAVVGPTGEEITTKLYPHVINPETGQRPFHDA